MRFVGRISYSLYLWHWPILTLPALALGEALPIEARLALGALSVVVGAISWRFIEEPFWHGSLSTFRPRPVLATAVATAIAVAVLAVGIGEDSLARVRAAGAEPVAQVSPATPATPPTGSANAAAGPSGFGRSRPVDGRRVEPGRPDPGTESDSVCRCRDRHRAPCHPARHVPIPSERAGRRIRGRSRPASGRRW